MTVDTPSDVATGDLFRPVSLGRVSGVIVDQIRLLLRQGRLRPGQRLPSERDLCERFGVSRVTVREALRVLEASGLVEIRVGARGGAFVTTPTSARLGQGLADLLQLSPLTPAEVTEARLVFEVGIVPVVMDRITEADLFDLDALCASQRTALAEKRYSETMSTEFHIRVAACSHNSAIEMLVRSFHGPLSAHRTPAGPALPGSAHPEVEEHQAFVDALRLGDRCAAIGVMHRHLARTTGHPGATAGPPAPAADHLATTADPPAPATERTETSAGPQGTAIGHPLAQPCARPPEGSD